MMLSEVFVFLTIEATMSSSSIKITDDKLVEMTDIDVESMLEEDSFYQFYATPLKPASVVKEEHRRQLIEYFKMEQLRLQIENAKNLIMTRLPDFVSHAIFSTIQMELDRSMAHFATFIGSIGGRQGDKPILFQEMFGYSDETLLQFYDLASKLVEERKYPGANDIFVYLTILAPHVSAYWIGQGICMQALGQHNDALAIFKIAKFLNPKDPFPSAYSIDSYSNIKDFVGARQELSYLQEIVNNFTHEEKEQWRKNIKKYRTS